MARPSPSIQRSVTTVILVTTFVALLVNAAALLVLDLRDFHAGQVAEARTQAEILARASAAAVAFDDRREAAEALKLLRENPAVNAAAIYRQDGRVFASYSRENEVVPPSTQGGASLALAGDRIRGFHVAQEPAGPARTVFLSVKSGLYDRLYRYVGLLVLVMLAALGVAYLLSRALQRSVTGPILAVADAARRVVERGDYSVRAAPQSGHETGLLADAFNRMLAEIDRRASEVQRQMREREHAEDALRAADLRKDRFLATLAHELRNPLAPITSSVHILKQRGGSSPEEVFARDVIDRQVRHMSRLLDDLLDVGRITNDKLELRRQRVTLSSIIDAALETSRPLIEAAGHRLEVRVPAEPIPLNADPVRLAQVFSNLLNNAAKYTAHGGAISLQVREESGEAVVTVRDSGIGIPEGELPHVFEIFSQASSGQGQSQGGLGIGLFLVKSILAMHEGSVVARSGGLGRGSEFEVRLPAASTLPAQAAAPRAPSVAAGRRRILIADDNLDAADSLALMLELYGNETLVVNDGAEALEKAEQFRPQIALLDIGMPVMDGYEAARRIRRADWGREMLLVAVTGWGQTDDRRRAFEAGFDSHLTKPARPEDLEAILGIRA